jgi:hypothetical protein
VKGVGEVGAGKLISKFGTVENIYAHIDELTPKQREAFENSKGHIQLSHTLVTIKTDIPVDIDEDAMLVNCEYDPKVADLFEKYEFGSLKKYLGNVQPTAPKEEKKGGSVSDFFPLLDVVLDFLSDIRRKLRVDLLEIRFCMAGGDPADLGIQYGRTVAAVSALDPQLERLFVIKKKHIRVECDFNGEKSQVWANVRLTITVGRILSMGLRHGTKALREYMKIMKLRKGGATK